MNLQLNIASNLKAFWHSQRGVFPPFMFGLLLGTGLFSVLSIKIAQKQLLELEEGRGQRQQAEREDIAKGLEFAILTETAATYSTDLTLERARQNTALSSGKTLGKDDFQLIEARTDDAFGGSQKRVLIASTDDMLRQGQNAQVADADAMTALSEKGGEGVTLFDSADVRFRQVETTKKRMDTLAEEIYRFYANRLKFPTIDEAETLAEKLDLKDVWGMPFTYKRISDTQGTLEFTTPWNYSQSLNLDLK